MGYKTNLQVNNTQIDAHNDDFQSLIDQANSLPNAGEAASPVIQGLTATENGTYEAPDGVDGYSPIVVNVPASDPVIQSLEATENGTYIVPDGVDGFSPVVVLVESGDSNEIDNLLTGTMTEIENDRITNLEQYALYYKTAIVKASFPNVTRVRSCAFRYATSLAEASLPAWDHTGTASSNSYIFANCKALTTVHVPSLSVVPNYTFQGCSALETLDLPVCTTVGSKAFYNCSKLTAVILRNTTVVTLSATDAFLGAPIESGTGYVYVPATSVDSYKAATNWSTFADQIRAIEDYPDITGG